MRRPAAAAFGTRQAHDETTVGELAAVFAHFIGERKVFVVAADMEERHRTVFGRTGAQHGDHRCDADAGADQNGRTAGFKDEFTDGRRHVNKIAHLIVVVKSVRHHAGGEVTLGGNALHGNAKLFRRRCGNRVLTRLNETFARDVQTHRDVLTGRHRLHGTAVGGHEHKARHGRGFFGLLRDAEAAPRAPAAFGHGVVAVEITFHADHNVGELTVGRSPGVDEFRGGGVAEHFLNGGKKVLADDAVMFGTNADGDMLIGNVLHGMDENARVFNILSVGKHGTGKRRLLTAGALMTLIEDLLQFRVALHHAGIKVRRQRNTVFGENGDGGLNQIDLLLGKHGWYSLLITPSLTDEKTEISYVTKAENAL